MYRCDSCWKEPDSCHFVPALPQQGRDRAPTPARCRHYPSQSALRKERSRGLRCDCGHPRPSAPQAVFVRYRPMDRRQRSRARAGLWSLSDGAFRGDLAPCPAESHDICNRQVCNGYGWLVRGPVRSFPRERQPAHNFRPVLRILPATRAYDRIKTVGKITTDKGNAGTAGCIEGGKIGACLDSCCGGGACGSTCQ